MPAKFAIAAILSATLLSACGETRGQRIATGAVGGAVAGQIIDERPVEGAVAGGLIGAVRP